MTKLWRQYLERREHRRRAKVKTVIATQTFETTYPDNGCGYRFNDWHIVSFVVDGNGRRSHEVRTTNWSAAESHKAIFHYATMWEIHGTLPDSAKRIVGKGNIVGLKVVK